MKVYLQFVLLVILITCVGCSSMRSVESYTPQVHFKNEKIQNYKLGEVQTAYVGENIIERGDVTYVETVANRYVSDLNLDNCIKYGSIHPVLYKDSNDGSLYVQHCAQNIGIKISKEGVLMDEYFYYYNIGGWQNNLMGSLGAKKGTKLFHPENNNVKTDEKSFRFLIIYTGLGDKHIRTTYKEFSNDMARPAFSQDFVYDLTESDIIRLKKIKIKVLEANNEMLTYVVLEDE